MAPLCAGSGGADTEAIAFRDPDGELQWTHAMLQLKMQTRLMPALDGWKEAAFVGYFGPIGQSRRGL